MKKTRVGIWSAVLAIVLSTVSACSLVDQPLGPELEVTPPTATSTSAPTPTPAATPTAEATQAPAATPTAEATQAAGLCGQEGRATVLFLGESLPEDLPARGASLIRLFQVDYDTGTVRVLALPPYLNVSTPALAEAGIESSALTFVYWEGLSLGAGSKRARMAHASSVLAQTLADNFGLVADNYFTVDQGTFVDMIDAWGGLEIDLPQDVDGSPSGFGYFNAGQQVMDGQSVLDYVSIYPAAGDASPIEWARLERQRQVIAACKAQLARPLSMARLAVMVPRFYQDIVTDLSLRQVSALACVLQAPDVSVEHLALGPEMVTVGPDETLSPKMDLIAAFLDTSFHP
jgi:hypothetical protein